MSWAFQPLLPGGADLLSNQNNLGYVKVWSGSTWIIKPVKFWNGSTWQIKPVKVWNGTSWQATNPNP